jgi:hypothetical protein
VDGTLGLGGRDVVVAAVLLGGALFRLGAFGV